MKEDLGRDEFEGVGAMAESGARKANAVLTQQGGEADEGIGQAVRLADTAVEEIVLAAGRRAGSQGDLKSGDG